MQKKQLLRQLHFRELKAAGAEPFIIPAMGSHGGATAAGQRAMLEGMGFTEQAMGAPIRATMETVVIGKSANGLPVTKTFVAHLDTGLDVGIFALQIDRHKVLLHQMSIVLQIHGDDDVGSHSARQRDGNRVHDATIDKPVTVMGHGRHKPGNTA